MNWIRRNVWYLSWTGFILLAAIVWLLALSANKAHAQEPVLHKQSQGTAYDSMHEAFSQLVDAFNQLKTSNDELQKTATELLKKYKALQASNVKLQQEIVVLAVNTPHHTIQPQVCATGFEQINDECWLELDARYDLQCAPYPGPSAAKQWQVSRWRCVYHPDSLMQGVFIPGAAEPGLNYKKGENK